MWIDFKLYVVSKMGLFAACTFLQAVKLKFWSAELQQKTWVKFLCLSQNTSLFRRVPKLAWDQICYAPTLGSKIPDDGQEEKKKFLRREGNKLRHKRPARSAPFWVEKTNFFFTQCVSMTKNQRTTLFCWTTKVCEAKRSTSLLFWW